MVNSAPRCRICYKNTDVQKLPLYAPKANVQGRVMLNICSVCVTEKFFYIKEIACHIPIVKPYERRQCLGMYTDKSTPLYLREFPGVTHSDIINLNWCYLDLRMMPYDRMFKKDILKMLTLFGYDLTFFKKMKKQDLRDFCISHDWYGVERTN